MFSRLLWSQAHSKDIIPHLLLPVEEKLSLRPLPVEASRPLPVTARLDISTPGESNLSVASPLYTTSLKSALGAFFVPYVVFFFFVHYLYLSVVPSSGSGSASLFPSHSDWHLPTQCRSRRCRPASRRSTPGRSVPRRPSWFLLVPCSLSSGLTNPPSIRRIVCRTGFILSRS